MPVFAVWRPKLEVFDQDFVIRAPPGESLLDCYYDLTDFLFAARERSGEVAASCPDNLDWRFFGGWALGCGKRREECAGAARDGGSRNS
jgi:hypothetical protein